MKTATITYHNVYNYGAVLQAYALQQVLQGLSAENVIIDYSHEKSRKFYRMKGKSIKLWIVNCIRLLETLRDYISISRRCKKFEAFTNTRLHLTRRYNSFKELRENPPQAELYLSGSDQLWNVTTTMKPAFFLDFGNQDTIRASYAVSMGSCHIPESYQKSMQQLLSRFNAISVRELDSKTKLEALLNRKDFIKVHLDPVFLLSREDWSEFAAAKKIKGKYILCYPMAGHPLMKQALKKLKKLTGYRIVTIKSEVFTRIKGDTAIKDASPEEFVFLIQNAEYVLTTSFHGTAFSIIFNVKFFPFLGNAPLRITSLLKSLGLENRIVKSTGDINTREIDYTCANTVIQGEKASASSYLSGLLGSKL